MSLSEQTGDAFQIAVPSEVRRWAWVALASASLAWLFDAMDLQEHPQFRLMRISLLTALAVVIVSMPHAGYAQQPAKETYLILLRLSPTFTGYLGRPGVMDAVTAAAREGHPPATKTLVALGLPEDFSRLFIERLGYLRQLHQDGLLWAAGPFAGFKEGAYVCKAADEQAARRVLEDDPLYRAGFIEHDFVVRRWLAPL